MYCAIRRLCRRFYLTVVQRRTSIYSYRTPPHFPRSGSLPSSHFSTSSIIFFFPFRFYRFSGWCSSLAFSSGWWIDYVIWIFKFDKAFFTLSCFSHTSHVNTVVIQYSTYIEHWYFLFFNTYSPRPLFSHIATISTRHFFAPCTQIGCIRKYNSLWVLVSSLSDTSLVWCMYVCVVRWGFQFVFTSAQKLCHFHRQRCCRCSLSNVCHFFLSMQRLTLAFVQAVRSTHLNELNACELVQFEF